MATTSNIHDVLLGLIRLTVSCKAEFDSKEVNWMDVISLATEQGVLGLTYDAIERLPSDQRPDIDSIMEWAGQVVYMESSYKQHKETIKKLSSFYHGHDIKMMLLKGYGLSLNWPVPEHRPTGDIDTYNFGKQKEADKFFQSEFGVKIDNSHHKHSVFSFDGVSVENHYSFLNIHGHRSTAEIEKILEEEINAVKDIDIENLYYPSVRFNSLYLLRHSAEHFASVDMNLRQVLDWGFFVRANNVDWDWLLSVLDKVGMKKYLSILNTICYEFLGFEKSLFPELLVEEEIVKRCLQDIFHPEVESESHSNMFKELSFRFSRWKRNGWKHNLIYKESMWQSLCTQMWSHILKPAF